MPLNPMKLLQIKNAWDRFTAGHPKFPLFLKAIQKQGITEGTILELKVTAPLQLKAHAGGHGAFQRAAGALPVMPGLPAPHSSRLCILRHSLICSRRVLNLPSTPCSVGR